MHEVLGWIAVILVMARLARMSWVASQPSLHPTRRPGAVSNRRPAGDTH